MSNQPRFEVFPERHKRELHGKVDGIPPGPLTGQYGWHLKDANGRITFTGGESFTRREDAHRAVRDSVADVLHMTRWTTAATESVILSRITIVDLDQNGNVIA